MCVCVYVSRTRCVHFCDEPFFGWFITANWNWQSVTLCPSYRKHMFFTYQFESFMWHQNIKHSVSYATHEKIPENLNRKMFMWKLELRLTSNPYKHPKLEAITFEWCRIGCFCLGEQNSFDQLAAQGAHIFWWSTKQIILTCTFSNISDVFGVMCVFACNPCYFRW